MDKESLEMTFKSKDIQCNYMSGSEEYYVSYIWYKNGKPYRLKGPAYITSNGSMCWFKGGKRAKVELKWSL